MKQVESINVESKRFRAALTVLISIGNMLCSITRYSIGSAIIFMTSPSNSSQVQGQSPQCVTNSSIELAAVSEDGYDWTEIEQGHVIGSYYYGYLAASLFINTFLNNFSPQVRF